MLSLILLPHCSHLILSILQPISLHLKSVLFIPFHPLYHKPSAGYFWVPSAQKRQLLGLAVPLLPLGNMPEQLEGVFGDSVCRLWSTKVHRHKREEQRRRSPHLRAEPQWALEWLFRHDAFCLGWRKRLVLLAGGWCYWPNAEVVLSRGVTLQRLSSGSSGDLVPGLEWTQTIPLKGFPGDSVVTNPPANAGDSGLIPELGRSPGGRNSNPLQYSCLGNPMDRGVWQAETHRTARVGKDLAMSLDTKSV